MGWNCIHVLLIQLFIAVGKSQRQYSTTNGGTSTVAFTAPFPYSSASYYYSPYVSPYYQYPYSSGPSATPSSYFSNVSTFYGSSPQQQYFLGPMTAAQAHYLTAHIQKLMHYGSNPASVPQVQIPSTPTLNASSTHPTPSPTTWANITSVNNTSDVNNSTNVESNTTFISPPSPNANDSIVQSADLQSNPSIVSDTNSSDPIVAGAHVQTNPFVPNPSYTIGNWLYNPFASMYANLPLRQPFYPPGYGPWNPFVLQPASFPPQNQSNETRQLVSVNSVDPKSFSQGGPEINNDNNGTSAIPTLMSSTAEGGMTDMENLPPQVKEFIDMIPDILSMPESSQLNPSTNNAIFQQLAGGSENVTPASSNFRKPKSSMRIKKKHFKPLRHRGNYM